MNAAISKLQKDIWKTETPGEDEKKKNKTNANNTSIGKVNKNDVKKRPDPLNSQTMSETKGQEKQSILKTLADEVSKQPISIEQPLNLEIMQQTAVSKIRRSIFQLPKSSPYTEYYPTEMPDSSNPSKEKIPESDGKKTKDNAVKQQSAELKAQDAKNSKVSPGSPTAKHPRSKALSRRQESKDKLKPQTDAAKENDDKEKDDKATGGNSLPEKRELQRMKGVFFCEKCQKRWKSIHVYCEPGTKHVAYGQICESCKTVQMPKRVSRLRCVTCSKFDCDCPVKREKLLEPKMVHRADLCVKCLSGDRCVH